MSVAYVIVTVLAAAANIYAAANDFTRPAWLLTTMSKLGVPESWLPILGILKAAGALGLLIGIGVPPANGNGSVRAAEAAAAEASPLIFRIRRNSSPTERTVR
jgi:DoxX-like family